MYDEQGVSTWFVELDSFGNVKLNKGDSKTECPFRYQGQTLDKETGLAYNRLRYYDPEQGNYISQDPIGLAGGNPTLYGYAGDPTGWLDVFGFSPSSVLNTALGGALNDGMAAHHLIPVSVYDEYNSLFTAVGIRRDDRSNGLLMPSSEAKAIALGDKDMITHVGGQPDHIASVKEEVERINDDFDNKIVSKRQAKKELIKIQKKYKSRIINKKVTTKITPCGGSNTMS